MLRFRWPAASIWMGLLYGTSGNSLSPLVINPWLPKSGNKSISRPCNAIHPPDVLFPRVAVAKGASGPGVWYGGRNDKGNNNCWGTITLTWPSCEKVSSPFPNRGAAPAVLSGKRDGRGKIMFGWDRLSVLRATSLWMLR
jgi:hypothetical protein